MVYVCNKCDWCGFSSNDTCPRCRSKLEQNTQQYACLECGWHGIEISFRPTLDKGVLKVCPKCRNVLVQKHTICVGEETIPLMIHWEA